MKMTKEKLAKLLNGREYRNEITKEEAKIAAENGLVVVYGGSDDLIEFEGAIYDELDCYEGGKCVVVPAGSKLEMYDEEEEQTIIKSVSKHSVFAIEQDTGREDNVIEAVWCEETDVILNGVDGMAKPSWHYKTQIPHARFNIMEDEEIYCIGIVFDINDVK